jgi:transposase
MACRSFFLASRSKSRGQGERASSPLVNADETPGLRVRIGCWAHVRRRIFDALATAPDAAKVGLDLIAELYRVEHDATETSVSGTNEHRQMR